MDRLTLGKVALTASLRVPRFEGRTTEQPSLVPA